MDTTQLRQHLLSCGLRPTRQRMAIAEALFSGPHRHITPEQLHRELCAGDTQTSLATVYNTLNYFLGLSLIRELSVAPGLTCFDTNTDPHMHIYNEQTGEITDADAESLGIHVADLRLPEGTTLARIDIVLRVRSA
ncbi:MAG: Fur family iron response transcriptional regulator [Myxococcota bacterium]|jgi:Fur family iron response transcriptional regulator